MGVVNDAREKPFKICKVNVRRVSCVCTLWCSARFRLFGTKGGNFPSVTGAVTHPWRFVDVKIAMGQPWDELYRGTGGEKSVLAL